MTVTVSSIIAVIKRRPLMWYAILAVFGVYSGLSKVSVASDKMLLTVFIVSLVIAIIIAVVRTFLKNYYSVLSILLFMFVGIAVFYGYKLSAVYHIKNKNIQLLHKFAASRSQVSVIGYIAGDANIKKNDYGYVWDFPVRLQLIKKYGETDTEYKKTISVIKVKWYGPPPDVARIYGLDSKSGPEYGERWLLSGKLYEIRHYGKITGYRLVSKKRTSEMLADTVFSHLARQCFAARRSVAKKLSVGIEDFPVPVALMRAVLLGYRSDLKRSMRNLFAEVGTLHIFAISGLHVGIVCSLIIFVLSVLTIPRTYWVLFLAPLLIAYTFATGGRPSAIRACIMAIVYFGAPLVWRKADSLSAVSFAALVILAFAPEQLMAIGFIYSFVVVCGLIILFPVLHSILMLWVRKIHIFEYADIGDAASLFWEQDDFQIEEDPVWVIRVRKIIRYLIALFALSVSAWLVSVPITAYYFGRVSMVAPLANVIVIPLAFLVVVTGVLSLLAGSCMLIFSDIFNHANLAIIELLVNIMRVIDKIPGSHFEVNAFSPVYVYAWYAVLLVIVYFYYKFKLPGEV